MKSVSESPVNPRQQSLPDSSLQGGKILVIEDSVDQCYILQKALEQVAPNLQPVFASNDQAVDALLQQWSRTQADFPQLILVDLYLPSRQDGWKTLEMIQSWFRGAKPLPLVIMSNSRDLEDIIDAYQHGIQSYIVKPHEFSDWLNCCRTLLGFLRKGF